MHTGSGVANRSIMSDENSSILSSESASSTSEAKGVTLTPLHAKQLTASDLFKSTPVGDKAKTNAISEGKLSTTTLSPLHATSSGILKQSTGDPQSPERKPIIAGSGSLAIGLSPVHTKLSSSHGRQLKVTEHSSPIHKQRDVDNGLLLQLRDAEKDTRPNPDIPKESTIGIPEDHLGPPPDQSQSIEQSVEVQSKSKQEDTTESSPVKSLLEADKSGLGEDLAELQSALRAAGLPPMTTKDEETPKEEPTQSSQSPKAIAVTTKDTKILQSSAPVDSKPKPLASFARDHSESDKHNSMKVSGHGEPESSGAIRFDLREAIRAIASEELTSISKEILKQQQHNVSQSQQPLPVDHETASASNSNDKKSEHGTESLFLRGDDEASHATYEGLEKFSDLLADIEHDSESHKSTTKYEGSRKSGRSSARKLTSTLPKTSTKASASKEGSVSKVDTRLSSKGIRTSSSTRSSYRTSSRLAELAAPKKVNKAPSATPGGSQAKPKIQPQAFGAGSSHSAPPKQLSSDRTSLKQYSGTTAKSTPKPSSSRRQHQIVIPIRSSSALESQSDSEDEIIHAAHEGGRKTNDVRPEIKMDAWKKALQEEKVCSCPEKA